MSRIGHSSAFSLHRLPSRYSTVTTKLHSAAKCLQAQYRSGSSANPLRTECDGRASALFEFGNSWLSGTMTHARFDSPMRKALNA